MTNAADTLLMIRANALMHTRRDNPKKPALKVFAQLVENGADAEALVRAAGAFAVHVKSKGFDPMFTPHARTWLAQERFEEWMTDAPASAPATGPSPDHPLAPLYPKVGDAAWASYFARLKVEIVEGQARVVAPTRFALVGHAAVAAEGRAGRRSVASRPMRSLPGLRARRGGRATEGGGMRIVHSRRLGRQTVRMTTASSAKRTSVSRLWLMASKAVMPRSFQKKGWMVERPRISQRGLVVVAAHTTGSRP